MGQFYVFRISFFAEKVCPSCCEGTAQKPRKNKNVGRNKNIGRIRTEEEKIVEIGTTAVIKIGPVSYAGPYYDIGEKMIMLKIF